MEAIAQQNFATAIAFHGCIEQLIAWRFSFLVTASIWINFKYQKNLSTFLPTKLPLKVALGFATLLLRIPLSYQI